MADDQWEINFTTNYDMNLSWLGKIYYVTDYMTDHIIIRYMILHNFYRKMSAKSASLLETPIKALFAFK